MLADPLLMCPHWPEHEASQSNGPQLSEPPPWSVAGLQRPAGRPACRVVLEGRRSDPVQAGPRRRWRNGSELARRSLLWPARSSTVMRGPGWLAVFPKTLARALCAVLLWESVHYLSVFLSPWCAIGGPLRPDVRTRLCPTVHSLLTVLGPLGGGHRGHRASSRLRRSSKRHPWAG